jgi:predicted enzyme related to lactoylglutathione lyase
MKIKYIPIFTEDVESQVRFFTDALGFQVCDKKNILASCECIIMQTTNPDIFILIAKDYGRDNRRCSIVVNTDDCLNDYHLLKLAGIQFYKEPQYTSTGLRAEFVDPSGNHCLLIEERNYDNLT